MSKPITMEGQPVWFFEQRRKFWRYGVVEKHGSNAVIIVSVGKKISVNPDLVRVFEKEKTAEQSLLLPPSSKVLKADVADATPVTSDLAERRHQAAVKAWATRKARAVA